MDNLKKVLALVLVVAMMMGFATVAGAADFTDAADVSHDEAVDVMTAIGVINGYPDGSFRPEGNVTRAQMAKMIAYIVSGGEDVGDLYAGATAFSDCLTHWARGYIAYANTQGIIAGVGNGRFNPDGNVTGAQAAKMMLCALGYDQDTEGYTGTGWSVNVLTDARTLGLLDGLNGVNMNAPLSREDASQLMFNALQATMVKYDRDNIVVDGGNGTTVVIGGSEASAVTNTAYSYQIGVTAGTGSDDDGTMEMCEQYFEDLKLNAKGSNAFGAPSHVWSYDGKIGSYDVEPDLTYTAGFDQDDLNDDLDALGMELQSGTVVYRNDNTGAQNVSAYQATLAAGIDPGTKVDFYDTNNNDTIDIIVVTVTYAGRIDNIIEDNEDTTRDERELEITVFDDSGSPITSVSADKDTVGFDEVYANAEDGDIVLVTPQGDNSGSDYTLTIAAAESVTGTMTRKTGSSVTVDGTAYDIADTAYQTGNWQIDASEEIVMYLDAYGNAIYSTNAGSDDHADVMYVTYLYKDLNEWRESVYKFQGVLEDGTVLVGEIDSDNIFPSWKSKLDSDDSAVIKEAMNYTVSNDKYTFIGRSTDYDVGVAKLTNGDSIADSDRRAEIKIGTASETNAYFTSDVQFVYVTGDRSDLKVTVKDGVQDLTVGANDYAVIVKDADGNYVISTVFVNDTAATVSEDLVYIASDVASTTGYTDTMLSDDGETTLYGFSAYLNGEKITVWMDGRSGKFDAGFYTYTIDDATGAYDLEPETDGATSGTVTVDYVNGNYYISVDDDASDEVDAYDASDAVVVDTNDNDSATINTLSRLRSRADNGTVTVAVTFDSDAETVGYIYVTNYTPDP